MWQTAISTGLKALSVFGAHSAAKAQYALGAARAKYENAIRRSRNQVSAAEQAVAAAAQSIANRNRLDAAGDNLARAGEALGRSQEAFIANSFSRRVQAAERTGEAVATAAFSGVIGGSAQQIIETAMLRDSMVQEVAERQQEQNEYELRKNASEQAGAGIAGLDLRLNLPNLDLAQSQNTAPKPGSLLGSFLQSGVLGVGLRELSRPSGLAVDPSGLGIGYGRTDGRVGLPTQGGA
jgi:hypothetical protein